MTKMHDSMYVAAFTNPENPGFSLEDLQKWLWELQEVLSTQHNGLFLDEVRSLSQKVRIFGLHFSTIDIRQDSRVISAAVQEILDTGKVDLKFSSKTPSPEERIGALFNVSDEVSINEIETEQHQDTLASFSNIRKIKAQNGDFGAYRFIISNCRGVVDIAHVFALARISGWKGQMNLDIIPLFETIQDLGIAGEFMQILYENKVYRAHLEGLINKQVIMLGFSDGTKDAGYLTAN